MMTFSVTILFFKYLHSIEKVAIVAFLIPPMLTLMIGIFLRVNSYTDISVVVSVIIMFIAYEAEYAGYMVERERQLSEEKLRIINNQMQPHFIFNTLSAIESLCQTDPQAAAESVENLAGYLRGNMDALTSEGLIPFDTEMRHIRQYIALEQTDPSRRFSFDYELNVRDFLLPALTIQPIVENAVKHGALTRRDGSGRVILTTDQIGRMVRITVTDNGTGNDDLTEAQKEKKGIGIESTEKRLETLCNGSLRILSDGQGTRAVILIPKQGG
jgi:LytS/YehU family sensor histidine kinase